jgi:thiol-disulfide isomerase/thioredoxin
MTVICVALLCVVLSSFTTWETNFDKALHTAKSEHKFLLINFSGSDWCGPCIKMHTDFFEANDFKNFADTKLVLVNADFPRQKKNQLVKELQKQNDHLADLYNAGGSFPLTVLLTPDGKVVKAWDGLPKMTVEEFIDDIKNAVAEIK